MDSRLKTEFFRKAAVAALALLPAGLLLAEAPNPYPEIEYAMPDQATWAAQVDESGKPTDTPLVRLARALFARAGIPWHGKAYPSARMFKYLQDGTAQFSMLVKAPALQECCLLSRKPVAAVTIRVYSIGPKPPIKAKEDMIGKSIIIVRGYSYAGTRDFILDPTNHIDSHEASTHAAAFRMLATGRADYVLDYAGPAADALAAEHIPDVRSELFSRQDIHLVLSRTYPNAEQVMARLESIVESLESEGAVTFPPQ
jgi:ABC-type amino acid transport substrate-binding protein